MPSKIQEAHAECCPMPAGECVLFNDAISSAPDHRCYNPDVAKLIMEKIRECEFATGRDITCAFDENQLPSTIYSGDTVTLTRQRLKQFRDDFTLLCMFAAHMTKNPHCSPIDLLPMLMKDVKP